ncbi:Caltractin [Diplonema papillatum]|nr:Caltractin [Diplonema papillatum]
MPRDGQLRTIHAALAWLAVAHLVAAGDGPACRVPAGASAEVVFRVSRRGAAELVRAAAAAAAPAAAPQPAFETPPIVVSAAPKAAGTGLRLLAKVPDPRLLHVCPPENPDDDDDPDLRKGGPALGIVGLFDLFVDDRRVLCGLDDIVLTIPVGASNVSRTFDVHRALGAAAQGREAVALEGEDIVHTTLQTAGPVTSQNNVVFLSSGYTAAEEAQFHERVDEIVDFLKLPARVSTGFANSVAFARYASLINIFSVFEPSPGSGASRPSTNLVVDSNLECTYGDPSSSEPERLLSCNMEKASALASTAPCGAEGKVNVVVVTIVNSDLYGGAGLYYKRSSGTTYRHASFFRGFGETGRDVDYASLFFHEMGHAYANLYDEYSFEMTSRGDPVTTPNCAPAADPSGVRWAGWITLGSSDEYLSVAADPVPVCGYTDYYKPSSNCIMEKLKATRLCPVCREATALAFYETGQDLAYPRCPLEGETVVLEQGEATWLHVNKRLVNMGDVAIEWSLNGNQQVATEAASSLRVAACDAGGCGASGGLDLGTHVFNVRIQDQTVWILEANRGGAMTKATTFTVRVVLLGTKSAMTETVTDRTCDKVIFDVGTDEAASYSSYCDASRNQACELSYVTSPYQFTADLNELADMLEGQIFGIVGASIAMLVLFFLFVWCFMARSNAKRAKCIFKADRPEYFERIRWTMVGSAAVCMCGAVAAITAGLVYYSRLGPIGKLLVFGSLGVAVALFVIAFVGFVAAWYRSKCALTLNGVLLFFCFIVATAWLIFAIVFYNSAEDDESWAQDALESLWEWIGEDDAMLCSLEQALECSGWYRSCQRLFSERYCPANCEATHSQSWASVPCQSLLKDEFQDRWTIIVIISIFLSIAMLVAFILNFILRRNLNSYRNRVRRSLQSRAKKHSGAGASMLSMKQAADAAHAAHPHFVDESANASRLHASLRRASAYPDSGDAKKESSESILDVIASLSSEEKRQLKKEFHRVDRNGDGMLDMKEFRLFLKTALMHDASVEEVQVVFDEVDKDGSGKIDFDEFVDMLAFAPGYQSPSLGPANYPAKPGHHYSSGNSNSYDYNATYNGSLLGSTQSHLSQYRFPFDGSRPQAVVEGRASAQAPQFAGGGQDAAGYAPPAEWKEAIDERDGSPYYYNARRETTRDLWEVLPDGTKRNRLTGATRQSVDSAGWVKVPHPKKPGEVYYWNTKTNETRLRPPAADGQTGQPTLGNQTTHDNQKTHDNQMARGSQLPHDNQTARDDSQTARGGQAAGDDLTARGSQLSRGAVNDLFFPQLAEAKSSENPLARATSTPFAAGLRQTLSSPDPRAAYTQMGPSEGSGWPAVFTPALVEVSVRPGAAAYWNMRSTDPSEAAQQRPEYSDVQLGPRRKGSDSSNSSGSVPLSQFLARIDRPPAAAVNRKAPPSRLVSPMSPAVLSMRSVTPSGGGLHGRAGRRPPPLSLTPAPSLAVPLLDDDRRQLAAAPQALPRRRSRTLNNTPPGYFHAGV